jgi:hypothetical protein
MEGSVENTDSVENTEGVLGFDSEDRSRRSEPRDPGVLVKNPGKKINANDNSFDVALAA